MVQVYDTAFVTKKSTFDIPNSKKESFESIYPKSMCKSMAYVNTHMWKEPYPMSIQDLDSLYVYMPNIPVWYISNGCAKKRCPFKIFERVM